MSDEQKTAPESETEAKTFIGEVVFWLGLAVVLIGLINVTPGIPGWD